jgi:hypothetical protein
MAKPSGDHTPLGGFCFKCLVPRAQQAKHMLSVLLVLALAAGFGLGYGAREIVSRRRRTKARWR